MNLFFTTTYADKKNQPRDLIAVAMVSEAGNEFYQVLEWDATRIRVFITQRVIPTLTDVERIQRNDLKFKFKDWILSNVDGAQSIRVVVDDPEHYRTFKRLMLDAGLNNAYMYFDHIVSNDYRVDSEVPYNPMSDVRAMAKANQNPQAKHPEYGNESHDISFDPKLLAWVCRDKIGNTVDTDCNRHDLCQRFNISFTPK